MQIDPKFAWTIITTTAGYLVALTLIVGKTIWDVKQLKERRVEDRKANKEEKAAIMSLVETFDKTCKEIRHDVKAGLYGPDNQTLYMPRPGCIEARQKCSEDMERRLDSIRKFHDHEIKELSRSINALCKKFDEWQNSTGKVLVSVSEFMKDIRGAVPHILSKGNGPNFNNATEKIDYDRIIRGVTENLRPIVESKPD